MQLQCTSVVAAVVKLFAKETEHYGIKMEFIYMMCGKQEKWAGLRIFDFDKSMWRTKLWCLGRSWMHLATQLYPCQNCCVVNNNSEYNNNKHKPANAQVATLLGSCTIVFIMFVKIYYYIVILCQDFSLDFHWIGENWYFEKYGRKCWWV